VNKHAPQSSAKINTASQLPLFSNLQISRRGFAAALSAIGLLFVTEGTLTGCVAVDEFITGKRTLVDDIGRTVTTPSPQLLQKVYFTSPLAQTFCFTMAPDLLAGTSIQFTKDQLAYLPAGTDQLQYMGSLSQGGNIDVDTLKERGVQLMLSISGTGLTDVNIADALKLQDQTGIPVFLIDGSFDKIGDTYRLLGKCFDRQERAEELAAYCKNIYDRITDAVSHVPDSERVTYYFAEGPEGLQTELDTSQHSLAFQVAGGINAASAMQSPYAAGEMVDITLDKIVEWNPQFIIAWDWESRNGADRLIRSSSGWAGIDAVKNNRVLAMPSIPFAFCDRPPGVNRFLGIQWLANLFYPDYFDIDMVATVRDFYSTCYWRDISDAQARRILNLDA
jgi:iron complex transport system substrate-binding protein